jgi:hypothetical protein
MSKKFAYDFDDLLNGDEELREIQVHKINPKHGSKFVLLLSPKRDDDKLKVFWPETKKHSDAPGALAVNQLAVYCWNETAWIPSPPNNFSGHSMLYQMYADSSDPNEHRLVMRQWFDPPKSNEQARFLVVPWAKLLVSLSEKKGGVTDADR